MIALIERYDPSSMRCIGTIGLLDPRRWSNLSPYSLLSPRQNHAIASFLAALPNLVHLDDEDATVVERALRDHWRRFLPSADDGAT